jgi:hypothetical protein
MILFILPNISGHARVHNGLKECLLAELEPADETSEVIASGEGYDENLHSSMRFFGEMFNSGEITQIVTCTICSSVPTRVEPFSKLLLQFPELHHEATPTNGSALPIVSSNITISGKKTFPTMIANIAARGHEQHDALK